MGANPQGLASILLRDLCEKFAIRRFVQNLPIIFNFDKSCQNSPIPLHRESNVKP